MIKKDTWLGDLLNALTLQPVYREPKPEKDENFYGGDKTWHDTGTIDVQLNKDGDVVAVWFRCRMLPFTQSTKYTADGTPTQGEGSIKGIVFEEDE